MCAKEGGSGGDTLDRMKVKLDKAADFGEWYNQLVELAELTDKRYPIKGMNVWRPYGWKLMRTAGPSNSSVSGSVGTTKTS